MLFRLATSRYIFQILNGLGDYKTTLVFLSHTNQMPTLALCNS